MSHEDHVRDADCAGHVVDETCQVCGVWGDDPCADCGGVRYHESDCCSSDTEARR